MVNFSGTPKGHGWYRRSPMSTLNQMALLSATIRNIDITYSPNPKPHVMSILKMALLSIN